MIDITERKNAELALDRPEDYFRTLVRQSMDIVTVVNARGVILYENPAAGRILGFDVSSRIGRNVFELVHPDDLDAASTAFDHVFAAGDLGPVVEFRLRTRRRRLARLLEAVGRRFVGDDGLMVAVINSRDVTDRRRMDERLRHAQKMEALVRLAGSMAHEFDQALAAIDQHLEAAKLPGADARHRSSARRRCARPSTPARHDASAAAVQPPGDAFTRADRRRRVSSRHA